MQRRTGEEMLVSDLTYDLRSGDPDALDQIVSITLANVAVDLIRDGLHGRLTAVQDGKYTHAPLPDPKLGPRKVDVGQDVQSRPLPAELRRPDRLAAAALLCGLLTSFVAGVSRAGPSYPFVFVERRLALAGLHGDAEAAGARGVQHCPGGFRPAGIPARRRRAARAGNSARTARPSARWRR